MARVNLENHLFGDPRLMILGAYLEHATSIRQACYMQCLGMLAMLWHESQAEQISVATGQQIRRWTLCPESDESIKALVEAGFIVELKNDSYEIVGNEKQIEALKSKNIKARSAANKRWQNKRENSVDDASSISNTNTNTNTKLEHIVLLRNTRQPAGPDDSTKSKTDKTDYQGFLKTWNDNRGRLAACSKLTDDRRKKIKSRLAENPSLDYWGAVIRRFAESNFVCESNWGSIDFLIRNETNVLKILEGRYDNKKPNDTIPFSFGEIWENYKKERNL